MEVILATDTYFSVLLSRPPFETWSIFLLGLARIVPTIAIAPFLGGKTVGDPVKLGFGVAVVVIFLPFLVLQVRGPLAYDITFFLLLFKEAVIGSILGFLISMPFYFSQSAGALIDHQRGSQSLQVMEPTTQMQSSPTGTLFNNMMLVSFFWIGGPLLFFDSIFTSYNVLPMESFFPPAFFESTRPFWVTIMGLINTFVKITLQLSAPSLIAMLLSDLFLGIANRMAPQVQISFLLWSLKAFIGIAMIWVGWWMVLRQFDSEVISWTKFYQKIVESMR